MPRAQFNDDSALILKTAKQLASSLIRNIVTAQGLTAQQTLQLREHETVTHFHDDSTNQIAWNDIQAILMYNEATAEGVPVPLVASEGYNQHYHTSDFDGGFIPGMGLHDHRDNVTGCGYTFAVWHPGTNLPQQHYSV
jgi:hypothetical protein